MPYSFFHLFAPLDPPEACQSLCSASRLAKQDTHARCLEAGLGHRGTSDVDLNVGVDLEVLSLLERIRESESEKYKINKNKRGFEDRRI